MKSLKVGDVVWVDCHKAKINKITGDGVVGLVLDDGLLVEFYYECSLHDISLDDNGDFVLDTEFIPVVGDVITINEKDFQLVDIDDDVVTFISLNPPISSSETPSSSTIFSFTEETLNTD